MKQHSLMIAAAVLALVLGVGASARIRSQKQRFDKTVHEALKTSEGYDQQFIDMVNRLERELAHRASFGYTGGKDPMTGKRRTVVVTAPVRVATGAPQAETPAEVPDPFKLTAVIFDDVARKYTAVIMAEERSFAVDNGEVVLGRKITNITNDRVFMEDDSMQYVYDISGRKGRKPKWAVKP